MIGAWDCANRACAAYHETSDHGYSPHGRTPRCQTCHRHLRLLHVRRPMPESVKRALREKVVRS